MKHIGGHKPDHGVSEIGAVHVDFTLNVVYLLGGTTFPSALQVSASKAENICSLK